MSFLFKSETQMNTAASDHVALDFTEPQLDLVEPRGICRGEVQMNLRMRFKELFDRSALVRPEIVGDHVDFLAARLVDHDVGEKGDELRRGVPLRGVAQDFASLRIEGGVQGQGAMPVVLKAVSFGTSRGERQ